MLRPAHLTLLNLLLISTSSYGQGFYFGGSVGPQSINFQQKSNILQPGNFNAKDTTNLSGTGLFGSLFGGYGWVKNTFYLAGEVNADLSSTDFKSSNKEFLHKSFAHTAYKIQHSFGFGFLPGYLYTPATLLYVRLGYLNSNIKISTTDVSLANIDKNLNGVRYGLGINQSFTKHLGARMEYSHANYQSTKFRAIDGTVTKTTRITPDSGQVEFSLIYNFA
ncbi:MAG: outer membrane beta-barrel protein [Gammaproteobacteria bacterium]|nr:outer membrane beta-barrel protein [Gammaproteobacteria bacterium]